MARSGRPRKGGKRRPGGRLPHAPARDPGNARTAATRAAFALFPRGKAAEQLGDAVGKVWAAGLLEGHGADSAQMRDAGREYGALWTRAFAALQAHNASAERLAGSAGQAADWAPRVNERRYARIAAIVARLPRTEREALRVLCLDHQDGDSLPPFAARLIAEAIAKAGGPAPPARPTRTDRERMRRAGRGLAALVLA